MIVIKSPVVLVLSMRMVVVTMVREKGMALTYRFERYGLDLLLAVCSHGGAPPASLLPDNSVPHAQHCLLLETTCAE